eukprot:352476-Chlamydomonas_euryale.AAC.10
MDRRRCRPQQAIGGQHACTQTAPKTMACRRVLHAAFVDMQPRSFRHNSMRPAPGPLIAPSDCERFKYANMEMLVHGVMCVFK